MNQYVCIHGHFYQPPRENPWLEEIELQDSAFPYHDWNERITDECYGPNATSRILDSEDYIERIVNNYSRISFNFGPTLLSWLEVAAPDVYRAILAADADSQDRFSGHGSALAQAYNHMILPLANPGDVHTQVLWGIRDFEKRFGRAPEGMWLPETAVDLRTLDALTEQGILFTILSPYQAKRVRKIGGRKWQDATGGKINPRMPYRQHLRSGRAIDIFFYDGPISQGVAFEGLLNRGEIFAERLMEGFDPKSSDPQLLHIATDGESYGHHHRHGDMALAYALKYIEENRLAVLTNYGEYLERFPSTHEVEIAENTSWSCAHGVGRWERDCGCNSGRGTNWNQQWRRPLRESLDWLRDKLAPLYAEHMSPFSNNCWRARDDYIEVILDRSPESIDRFLGRHARRILTPGEKIRFLKLLEMQRHAMLMYTSCGWFFDEISGIETVQVLDYAGRAIQLAEEAFGDSIEQDFLTRLEQARSNIPEMENGRRIYERFVRPAFVDLTRVCAHYAIASLFEDAEVLDRVHCYHVSDRIAERFESGRSRMMVGTAVFESAITGESQKLSFVVAYFDHLNLHAGVRPYGTDETFQTMLDETSRAFDSADIASLIRTIDKHFSDSSYSFTSLFRDQQRDVLDQILDTTYRDAEALYRQFYDNHLPLLRFFAGLDAPTPNALRIAADFVVNAKLKRLLTSEELNPERVEGVLEEARIGSVTLNKDELKHLFQAVLERKARAVEEAPRNLETLEALRSAAALLPVLPFEVTVRKVQNIVYGLIETVFAEMKGQRDAGSSDAQHWCELFVELCNELRIRLP